MKILHPVGAKHDRKYLSVKTRNFFRSMGLSAGCANALADICAATNRK
jgi:hypothetical protein